METLYTKFITGLLATHPLEAVAVLFGILSVVFSRLENILVYPTGLVNTILYTWFCFSWWGLYAEGSLNFYYTAMSIYGWWAWKRGRHGKALRITYNDRQDWLWSIALFVVSWVVLYFILVRFTDSTVPMGDSFASAAAYTGMWQMARKKVENWWWWIGTNIASVPLYFVKGGVFTSVQYVVFLGLAVAGLIAWRKKARYQIHLSPADT